MLRVAADVLSQFAPAFHGFYRAIISTPFSWRLEDWHGLSEHLNVLFATDVIERLNCLLVDSLQSEQDTSNLYYIQTLLSRYVTRGRPLNGYFFVCCLTEAQWTILAQTLCPPKDPTKPGRQSKAEAAAANKAWSSLTRHVPDNLDHLDSILCNALKETLVLSTRCFTDLLVQIEEMESEPSLDSYAWETLSESLVGYHTFQS